MDGMEMAARAAIKFMGLDDPAKIITLTEGLMKTAGVTPEQIGEFVATVTNGHRQLIQQNTLIAQGLLVVLRQQSQMMDHLNLQADDASHMLMALLSAPKEEHGNGGPGNSDGGNPGGGGPV